MVSIKQSKFIKSLKIKKYRTKEKCFIAEGRKNVLEGLDANLNLRYLLVTAQFLLDNESALQFVGEHLIEVSKADLETLGTFTTNHDCLAVFEMPVYSLQDLNYSDHIIGLDGINDPGNLGTIIRTMDWFGFKNLVCSIDTTDAFSPKVINATMGSYTRIRVYYTDLGQFIEDAPIQAFGADLGGIALGEWKPDDKCVLVMGSESHGLSESVKSKLSSRVTITKLGAAESLNVGIATGIFCHHLRS